MLLDEFERIFFAFRLAIDLRNPECHGRSDFCRKHFRVILDDYACGHQGFENFLVHLQKTVHLMPCRDFGKALAAEVVRLCEEPSELHFSYDLGLPIKDKLQTIATRIYHADGVTLTPEARKQAKTLTELGFAGLPVCVAKTQYSFSDNAKLLGAPKGFKITIRDISVSAGAGFLVALAGDIMTMPGLPKVPAAENIDIDEDGKISGLF